MRQKKWQFGISLSDIAIGKQEEASVEGWFLGISCFPQHEGQRDNFCCFPGLEGSGKIQHCH